MYKIWTVMKKELRRVFTDVRMIFSLFVLPPLIIVVIYGIMGIAIKNMEKEQQEYIPKIVVSNAPGAYESVEGFKTFLEKHQFDQLLDITYVDQISETQLEEYKAQLLTEILDALIVFPADFVDNINNPSANLKVDIYQNNNSSQFYNTQNLVQSILSIYENRLLQEVLGREKIAIFTPNTIKLAPEEKETVMVLGMILPFLLIIFLMSSAMGVGIESVAGEKERGTIATLLVTPIKRSELAIGKIFSVAILGILSSISSFVGMVISLPIYVGSFMDAGSSDELGFDLGAVLSIYGAKDFVMMFIIILMAVLLFVALVILVSTFAKSLKESNALYMPVYIITLGVGVYTMFSLEAPKEILPYLIPVYNIIVGLKAVMLAEMTTLNFLAVVASTLFYTILLVLAIQKMFKSESIMFKQ